MSSNGQYQSACADGNGAIYNSSNYGQTWTQSSAPSTNWKSICMSSNGQYQTACVIGDDNIANVLYTSSNYGQTWTSNISVQTVGKKAWYTICMSANGQYQSAGLYNWGIYISSDYGETWSQSNNSLLKWQSISMSSNGQYQSVCVYDGTIYISSNYGQTWTLSSAQSASWNSICMSANGQYQSACVPSVGIYISSNYGKTWSQSNAQSDVWNSICMSANGQYLSACITGSGGGIYTSVTPYPNIISSGIVTSSSMAINKQITDIINGYKLDVSGNVHINGNCDVSNNIYAKNFYTNNGNAGLKENGAFVGTSLDVGAGLIKTGGTINSGSIVVSRIDCSSIYTDSITGTGQISGGSISGGSISGGSISGGSISGRYLDIVNDNSVSQASINIDGGISGKNLSITGGPIQCKGLDAGSSDIITTGTVSGKFSGTITSNSISVSGNIESTGASIKTANASMNGSGVIKCTAINCTSLDAGSGIIKTTGQITGFSFNASSDYRIKENVQNLDETFTIDNLRPVHYDTISNKHHAIGFIAHEIQEHYPYLVDGEKDSPNKTQSMNYNGLIGILVHEIQQLKQTIGEQKSQIADILGQISDIKK